MYVGQVTKLRLSCYLVLLSNDSKTRWQDSHSFVTWPICKIYIFTHVPGRCYAYFKIQLFFSFFHRWLIHNSKSFPWFFFIFHFNKFQVIFMEINNFSVILKKNLNFNDFSRAVGTLHMIIPNELKFSKPYAYIMGFTVFTMTRLIFSTRAPFH